MKLLVAWIGLFAWSGAAWAGAPEDMATASSKAASKDARMQAFDRIVALGATDMALVSKLSVDEDASARERWVAIRALGKIGGDRSKNLLRGLLNDPQPAMRAAASSALGDLGDPGFVGPLCERVKDPAVIVRAAAAGALGSLGDSEAVSYLSNALADKRNTFRGQKLWVRKHFVLALGAIGDKAAYPALLRSIDDDDPDVATLSIDALEKVAGFSFSEGRSERQEREAWRRYISNELR